MRALGVHEPEQLRAGQLGAFLDHAREVVVEDADAALSWIVLPEGVR